MSTGWTSSYDGTPLPGVRYHRATGQASGRATQSTWIFEINAEALSAAGIVPTEGHRWTTANEHGLPMVSGPITVVGRAYATSTPKGGLGLYRLTVNDMSAVIKKKFLPTMTSKATAITRDVTEYAKDRAQWLITSHFPDGLVSSDFSQIASGGTQLTKSQHLVIGGQGGTSDNFAQEFSDLDLWTALDSIFTYGGFLWYLQPDPAHPLLSRVVSYDPHSRHSPWGVTDSTAPDPGLPGLSGMGFTGAWVSANDMNIEVDIDKLVNALRITYIPIGSQFPVEAPSLYNEASIARLRNDALGDDGKRWAVLGLGTDVPIESYASSLGAIYFRWIQLANVKGQIKIPYKTVGCDITPGMSLPVYQREHSDALNTGNVNSITYKFENTPDNLPSYVILTLSQDPYTWPTSVGGWQNDPIRIGQAPKAAPKGGGGAPKAQPPVRPAATIWDGRTYMAGCSGWYATFGNTRVDPPWESVSHPPGQTNRYEPAYFSHYINRLNCQASLCPNIWFWDAHSWAPGWPAQSEGEGGDITYIKIPLIGPLDTGRITKGALFVSVSNDRSDARAANSIAARTIDGPIRAGYPGWTTNDDIDTWQRLTGSVYTFDTPSTLGSPSLTGAPGATVYPISTATTRVEIPIDISKIYTEPADGVKYVSVALAVHGVGADMTLPPPAGTGDASVHFGDPSVWAFQIGVPESVVSLAPEFLLGPMGSGLPIRPWVARWDKGTGSPSVLEDKLGWVPSLPPDSNASCYAMFTLDGPEPGVPPGTEWRCEAMDPAAITYQHSEGITTFSYALPYPAIAGSVSIRNCPAPVPPALALFLPEYWTPVDPLTGQTLDSNGNVTSITWPAALRNPDLSAGDEPWIIFQPTFPP